MEQGGLGSGPGDAADRVVLVWNALAVDPTGVGREDPCGSAVSWCTGCLGVLPGGTQTLVG